MALPIHWYVEMEAAITCSSNPLICKTGDQSFDSQIHCFVNTTNSHKTFISTALLRWRVFICRSDPALC